jgi:hypothetical protein
MVQVLVPREYVDEAKELLAARLDELPADKEPVVVAEVKDGGAGFLAAALRSAGIPAIVRPSRYSGASGGVLVPPHLADDAKEVIAALEQGAADEALDEDDELEPDRDQPEDDETGEDEGPKTGSDEYAELRSADGGDQSGSAAGDELSTGSADLGLGAAGGLDAGDGPPAYGSDLRPDYGGSGPGGNGARR